MKQQHDRNRRWVLASRPKGAPTVDNFRLEEDTIATRAKAVCCCEPSTFHLTPICAAG